MHMMLRQLSGPSTLVGSHPTSAAVAGGVGGGGTKTSTWSQFTEQGPVSAHRSRYKTCLRRFMLSLISGLSFPFSFKTKSPADFSTLS